MLRGFSDRRKSSPEAIFFAETVFPCAKGAAGENGKETLLCKASEADAHVVSFGTRVGGLRPSDTSHRGSRQSAKPLSGMLRGFCQIMWKKLAESDRRRYT